MTLPRPPRLGVGIVLLAAAVLGCSAAAGAGSAPPPAGAPSAPATIAGAGGTPAGSPPAAWGMLAWQRPALLPPSATVLAAVSVGGRIVIAGFDSSGGVETAQAWTSADGASWTSRIAPTAVRGEVERLVFVAGRLVGVGVAGPDNQPAVWTSDDRGEHWTTQEAGALAGAHITGVASDGASLVAVGDRGWGSPAAWLTRDAVTWREATASASPDLSGGHLAAVSAFSGGFVAAGQLGGSAPTAGVASQPPSLPAAWTSADGLSWRRARVAAAVAPGGGVAVLAAARGGLVAVGSDDASGRGAAVAWVSADGTSWRRVAAAGLPPSLSVAGDGEVAVAWAQDPAGADRYWASDDGAAWRQLAADGDAEAMPGADGGDTAWPHADLVVPAGPALVVVGTVLEDASGRSLPVWLASAG